mmetsp:Transcript_9393/g.34848  ORF Transcript_9393/g.34848 Transcript_9393/m.34848 type:complete len:279 (+) Transcript_9393:77-913(+)
MPSLESLLSSTCLAFLEIFRDRGNHLICAHALNWIPKCLGCLSLLGLWCSILGVLASVEVTTAMLPLDCSRECIHILNLIDIAGFFIEASLACLPAGLLSLHKKHLFGLLFWCETICRYSQFVHLSLGDFLSVLHGGEVLLALFGENLCWVCGNLLSLLCHILSHEILLFGANLFNHFLYLWLELLELVDPVGAGFSWNHSLSHLLLILFRMLHNFLEKLSVGLAGEGHSSTLATSSCCTTDTMNVVLKCDWHVEINDTCHIWHIDTPRTNISTNEEV